MRTLKEYRERCLARKLSEEAIEATVGYLREMEEGMCGRELDDASQAEIEAHLASRMSQGKMADRVMAFARYFLLAKKDEVAIRLLAYLSPIGILPSMAERLEKLEGKDVRDRVMAGVVVPLDGSPPEAFPPATAAFVKDLERELGADKAARVLRWNVHGVPAQAHDAERELFEAAPSVAEWLRGYHARQVAILEKHAADGTIWYEQKITAEAAAYVKADPEIMGGVVKGNKVYMTKIPYDPSRFLASRDPVERRRLACHCPMAVASITEKGAGVPAIWCQCSAGFEKFLLDCAFGEETEATVLESVLAGDPRCRFEITIPPSVLARKPAGG